MADVILPKSGATARIDVLDASALAEVLSINEAVRTFSPMQGVSMPQSGTAYYQNLLMRVTGLLLGARVDGKLVAHLAVIGPLELREAMGLHDITAADISYHHAALTDSVSVIDGFAARPEAEAEALSAALWDAALVLPLVNVADHVFAQAVVGEGLRCTELAGHGFAIVGAANDPRDGLPRFIYQKPSFGFDCDPWPVADEVDPVEDFSAIRQLTQREALVGFADENAPGKLAFMRNRELLNLMPTVARVQNS